MIQCTYCTYTSAAGRNTLREFLRFAGASSPMLTRKPEDVRLANFSGYRVSVFTYAFA